MGKVAGGDPTEMVGPHGSDHDAALAAPLGSVDGAVCVSTVCKRAQDFVCGERCLHRQENVSDVRLTGKGWCRGRPRSRRPGHSPGRTAVPKSQWRAQRGVLGPQELGEIKFGATADGR